MKVLIINGSPKNEGNTATAIKEMVQVFTKEGVETEILNIGKMDIRSCIGCGKCDELGKCVFDDIVNETAQKLAEADGMIVASPVYYAGPNPTLLALLTRLFYSNNKDLSMKVGASVVCCRRGGAASAFDQLNKFFTISNMPVVSSQYWNSIHGCVPGEAEQDEEGKQVMRVLARNMTFLMKCIALGKEKFGLPEKEEHTWTNFI